MNQEEIKTIGQLFEKLKLPCRLVAGDPRIALEGISLGSNSLDYAIAENSFAIDIIMLNQFCPNSCWAPVSPEKLEEYVLKYLKLKKEKYGPEQVGEVLLFAQEREGKGGFGYPVYYSGENDLYAFVSARYRDNGDTPEIEVLKMINGEKLWKKHLTIPEIAELLF